MKKNSFSFKVLLAVIFTLLLAVTVSACNFSTIERVATVSLKTSGLEQPADGDGYIAVCGKEFVLTADIAPDDYSGVVRYCWFRQVNSGNATQIIGEGSRTFRGLFENVTDDVYTYFATANGIKSSSIIVRVEEFGTLGDVKIVSSTHDVIQNTVQLESGGLSPVELSAAYDTAYFGQDYEAGFTYRWYENGEEIVGAADKSYIYTPYENDEKTTVSVTVSDGLGLSRKSAVGILIIYGYAYVDEVSLSVSGAEKKEAGHYFEACETSGGGVNVRPITLSAEVKADGTNLSAPAVWTLRTESGSEILAGTGREITVTPKYGKNVYTATIDNVDSKEVTVYALTETDYRRRAPVINDVFLWYGNLYSFYIMDGVDLSAMLNHLVAEKETASDVFDTDNIFDMYLQPVTWRTSSGNDLVAFSAAVRKALNDMDVSGLYSVSYTASELYFTNKTVFGKAEKTYQGVSGVKQNVTLTHFSTSDEPRTRLPIDSAVQTVTVKDSDALFRAAGSGIKPVFPDTSDGRALKTVYGEARAVLYEIIDDGMTEFEKVRAVYEWITNNVDYDYDAAEDNSPLENILPYNAFYLEGVFNDRKAVCDGKSKAFTLMCGMEGIRSVRIVGRAGSEKADRTEEEIGKLSGHAWNKVLVDADGNGVREWYVADTTWGDVGIGSVGTSNVEEYSSMAYFLVTDDDLKDTHYSSLRQPAARTVYDYYASETVLSDGVEVSFDITSAAELKAVLAYSKMRGGVLIEVKNNFDDSFAWYISKFVGELNGKSYTAVPFGNNRENNNWLISVS